MYLINKTDRSQDPQDPGHALRYVLEEQDPQEPVAIHNHMVHAVQPCRQSFLYHLCLQSYAAELLEDVVLTAPLLVTERQNNWKQNFSERRIWTCPLHRLLRARCSLFKISTGVVEISETSKPRTSRTMQRIDQDHAVVTRRVQVGLLVLDSQFRRFGCLSELYITCP